MIDGIGVFFDQWAAQLVRGWDYATSWESTQDLVFWLSQILPEEWHFVIGGIDVRLADYLGDGGAYYNALSVLLPYVSMADYFIDVRLLLLLFSISASGRLLIFSMSIWSFFSNWRRNIWN